MHIPKLPGYFPEGTTFQEFQQLLRDRPALLRACLSISNAVDTIAAGPKDDPARQEYKRQGRRRIFNQLLDDWISQDMAGWALRMEGIPVQPATLGDVYAEYLQWKEDAESIQHLDFTVNA